MSTATPNILRSAAHTYRVVSPLGKGGQGTALLVERDDEPGSRYVLKQLRMEHVDDWKQAELFEREVSTLAALKHPGIPRLIDRITEDKRTAGIVQTLVPGHTIAAQIAEHGPLSAARFEHVLRQGLEILAYLHGQVPPVLHRDINPRNVMIGPERTYVIDFGAVRVGGTTDMTSVGTFGYMAPEQLIGHPEPASDVFGLGMTLVSLAEHRDVGDLPLDARTGRVDPSELLRGMEPRLRDLVLAMIEPGLNDRLGDADEALRRLDAPPTRSAPPPLPELRSRASVSMLTGLTGLTGLLGLLGLLAIGVGIGAFLMLSSDDQPPVPVTAVPSTPAAPVPDTTPSPVPPPSPAVPHAPPPPTVAPQVVPRVLTDQNSAELTLTTTPAAAMVAIDGIETCTTPCVARVTFGEHRVVFVQGGRRVDRSLMVLEDTTLKVALSQ